MNKPVFKGKYCSSDDCPYMRGWGCDKCIAYCIRLQRDPRVPTPDGCKPLKRCSKCIEEFGLGDDDAEVNTEVNAGVNAGVKNEN